MTKNRKLKKVKFSFKAPKGLQKPSGKFKKAFKNDIDDFKKSQKKIIREELK